MNQMSPTTSSFALADAVAVLRRRVLHVVGLSLLVGLVALGIAFLIPPTYVARTLFIPPQPASSTAATALASIGALSTLAGAGAALRTPADQYIAFMQSATVTTRIITQFALVGVYKVELMTDARKVLNSRVRFVVGKKDGLVTVEVDDENPQRAADIANRHIDELRVLTASLAVTEAQQRRVFFERQLDGARGKLASAQRALQESGFSQAALNSEPRSAAESYARLRAQAQAVEVRLQALRDGLSDDTPEVRQQTALLAATRAQLARAETAGRAGGDGDYVARYREYKYQETLFDIYARQFELARIDESREGSLIQVIDRASPPERRSRPRRALTAVSSTLIAAVLLSVYFVLTGLRKRSAERPVAG